MRKAESLVEGESHRLLINPSRAPPGIRAAFQNGFKALNSNTNLYMSPVIECNYNKITHYLKLKESKLTRLEE